MSQNDSTRRGLAGGCKKVGPGGAAAASVSRGTHTRPVTGGTVRYWLAVTYQSVTLPRPTQEYGGLWPARPGCTALVDIGTAQYIDRSTAQQLAGAVAAAAQVQVVGDNPLGVEYVTDMLGAIRDRQVGP